MGLETASPMYIKDLVTSWPLGSDKRSTADDHHRITKAAVVNTFSGLSGASHAADSVSATVARMNDVFVNALLLNAANVMTTGTLNMSTQLFQNATIDSYREFFVDLGVVNSAASATLDLVLANQLAFTIATATLTLSFAGWPSAGVKGTISVEISQGVGGGGVLVFPSAVKWPGGVKPPMPSGGSDLATYTFTSRDNGATILGYQTGYDFA